MDKYNPKNTSRPKSGNAQNRPNEVTGRPLTTQKRRTVVKRRQKSHFGMMFTIIIFVGAIVTISACAIAFSSILQGSASQTTRPPSATATTPAWVNAENAMEVKEICIIKSIDYVSRNVDLYSVDRDANIYMHTGHTTDMRDKYGKNMVFNEFRVGDIVEITYYEGETQIVSMRHNAMANTYVKASIEIDPELGVIRHGNNTYSYNSNIICLYKGEPFDIDKITNADEITLKVYKSTALFLEVTQSHGIVNVYYYDGIFNATLEIDTKTYTTFNEDKQYTLSEGSHRIVIKGSNIENYVRDIFLESGEVLDVYLTDIQIKSGILTFSSNEENIDITINGYTVTIDEYVPLEYGKYTVKASKNGFLPFEYNLDFADPFRELKIEMNPVPTPTPKPTATPKPEKIPTVKVVIDTDVQGASVYIDNVYMGATPVTVNVEIGNRTLLITKDGYADIDTIFIVNEENNGQTMIWGLQPTSTILPR